MKIQIWVFHFWCVGGVQEKDQSHGERWFPVISGAALALLDEAVFMVWSLVQVFPSFCDGWSQDTEGACNSAGRSSLQIYFLLRFCCEGLLSFVILHKNRLLIGSANIVKSWEWNPDTCGGQNTFWFFSGPQGVFMKISVPFHGIS